MKKIPLTFFPGGKIVTDEWLPIVFAEFAANGAENIVINELMAPRFLTDPRLQQSGAHCTERRCEAF